MIVDHQMTNFRVCPWTPPWAAQPVRDTLLVAQASCPPLAGQPCHRMEARRSGLRNERTHGSGSRCL